MNLNQHTADIRFLVDKSQKRRYAQRVRLNKLSLINCVVEKAYMRDLDVVQNILHNNYMLKTIDIHKQEGLHEFITTMVRDGFSMNHILSGPHMSTMSCSIRECNQLLFDVSGLQLNINASSTCGQNSFAKHKTQIKKI
jgi:hypothetical protein